MADEQTFRTFVTNHDPDPGIFLHDYDITDPAFAPEIYYPGLTTYGQTPEFRNYRPGTVNEWLYKNDPFPGAVEMCVPSATTQLMMWMHV